MVVASPTRPRLGIQRFSKIQSPGLCWLSPLRQGMAPTSTLRRPTGYRPAASKIARGAHPSRGSRPRGTRLPGLEVGGQQTVGAQAPPPPDGGPTTPYAAREKKEADHRQCLLDEHAANKRQEAAHKEAARRQHLLDEEAARCLMDERAALARQMGAACTIFLWLRRHRLHIRLARQTLRQQQCKTALARLR